MAAVVPFRALRYRLDRINGPLSAVVAPPYDVISPAQQEELHRRSPHNVVRLILGRRYPGDRDDDNRYTRSARRLAEWSRDGVLSEDAKPAFYVYEQTFQAPQGMPPRIRKHTRRGVFVALALEPFGRGGVFPHEETFSAPKTDRLNLTRACRANFSPVFGLVPDAEKNLLALLEKAAAGRAPDLETKDDSGILNRVWTAAEPAFCASLAQILASRKVFIADGHHRYETACNYQAERRAAEPNLLDGQLHDYVLMVCVPMSDPGLRILPTHRVIEAKRLHAPTFLKKCETFFTIRDAEPEQLAALAEDDRGALRFGLVLPGPKRVFKLLAARPALETAMAEAAPQQSPAWRALDTAVAHEIILSRLLGVSRERSSEHEVVSYTKDLRDVLAAGSGKLGLVLRPAAIEQVRTVAEGGERMPHKSTYFHPKLLSGLVMRRL